MLVGDQHAVDALGTFAAERFEAPQNFLAAESGVNKESGVLGFEQRGVAGTARSEDRYAERDAVSPKRMMAK